MTEDPKRLTHALLGGSPSDAPSAASPEDLALTTDEPVRSAGSDAGADPAAQASELIDLYFDLEEPLECDVVFERLIALASPIVDDFLLAMVANDEDEFMRFAAAAELCRRGHAEATDYIEAELHQSTDDYFFEQAVRTLTEVRGAAFFPTLMGIWQDPGRDAAARREAMVNLEFCDTPRAMVELVAFVDSLTDPTALPDDQLEIAMAAFTRHGHTVAIGPLTALRQRILEAVFDDPAEQKELAALVQEGIDLLQVEP